MEIRMGFGQDKPSLLGRGLWVSRHCVVMSLAFLFCTTNAIATEGTCPTAPSGFASFASALNGLVDRLFGLSSERTVSPLAELDDEQEKDVLDKLAEELAGKRAELADGRQEEEAEERLQSLRQRILSRDRLEQDAHLARRRGQDAMGQVASPRLRDPKPLSEILEEETEKDNPSLGQKYAKAYGEAIRRAIESDPKSFAETAGRLAGGDYKGALPKVMEWGASGFATVVGDALDEMGYESTKSVWSVAVGEAATAKDVMQAIAHGDHESAWDSIKERAKQQVKAQGRAAAKHVIDWATDISGETPSLLGKTPGELYLDLLDAEVEMIEWSKTYLREKSEVGDGACIRLYEEAYPSRGQDVAFDKFHECTVTAKYSAFPEFGNQARRIGLNENAALTAFLEAHRKRESNAWTPSEWIAERVAERQAELEKTLLPELSRAETVMANLAEAAGRAVDNRLTELAALKLNERQWDKLEAKVRELERLLEATLSSVKADFDRIRKNSDAVAEACKSYDGQKKAALEALNQGLQLSVASTQLLNRLTALDTSVCRSEGSSPAEGAGMTMIREAITALASESELLDAELLQVCRAEDSIETSGQKEEAKVHLDRALARARDVQARGARLKVKAGELVGFDPGADSAGAADPNAERRREIIAGLSAAKGEIEALAGRSAQLRDQMFKPAHQAMAAAQRRIAGLVPVTSDMIERTKTCLAPLAEAPIADEPRRLLAELEQRSTDGEGCLRNVNESWLERDLDPGTGGSIQLSAPWERRELTLTVPVDRLRAKVAEIEELCSHERKRETAPASESDSDTIAISTAERAQQSLARLNECVSAALVAYANIGKTPGDTASEPDTEAGEGPFGGPFIDLTGTYECLEHCPAGGEGKFAKIEQSGDLITYINEGGGKATGRFVERNAVVAVEWGNLRATVSDDASELRWTNGTIWRRAKADQALPSMEMGMNRPGSDYGHILLDRPSPELCQSACQIDNRCRAWTYVKPGIQGPTAYCWLKNPAPAPIPDPVAISGLKVDKPVGSASPAPGASSQAPSAPGNRQYFVYYKDDEFTCCKNERGETPHPLHIGEIKDWSATHRKLAGPFESDETAKQWACNHEIYKAQAWISNWARVGGVLVSNLPCQANR
jgi:hypothetical protein